MNIKSLKCPECGAPIQADVSQSVFYCSHCGCKLCIEDQTQEVIKEKELEHEITLKKMDDKKQYIYLAILIVLFLIVFIPFLIRTW